MWVFTIDGFYSAVQHRDHADSLTVRTRDREDMVRMQQRVGNDAPISHTPHRDYAHRITLSKAAWAGYLTAACEAIDYGNFKDAVAERQGWDRAHLYGEVWVTMLELQREGA
jgi:hypothetical protein